MKNKILTFWKIILLIIISIICVVLFNFEAKSIIPKSFKFFWPREMGWSLFCAPVLFFTWLFVICREKLSWKKLCLVLLSYLLWFVLSYDLWSSLIGILYGAPFTGYFAFLSVFFFTLIDNILHLQVSELFFIFFTALGFALLYSLFIFENLFLKKILNLTYKKIDYILLFAYPVFICFFSIAALLFLDPAYTTFLFDSSLRHHFLEIYWYFYSGVIILAYMMTQGIFFVKITSKQID